MPAYSFKERFIPFLKDGSKLQTIRKKRKGQAIPGDTVYLYYGMRTKYCMKIGEGICRDIQDIEIHADGVVMVGGWALSINQKDKLAWDDGFRPDDGSSPFELMMRFWKQTHELPFKGDIIYWNKTT